MSQYELPLPEEIQDHIKKISHDDFSWLQPTPYGISSDPLFQPQSPTSIAPSIEDRCLDISLPDELEQIYMKYDDRTEFVTKFGWTFLSETEMKTRYEHFKTHGQSRMTDLAIKYGGMGHIAVLVFDPESKLVFTDTDGGSNDFDRMHNFGRRIALDVEMIEKKSFKKWKESWC